MKTRRTFLLTLTCAAVALGLVVLPALADELYGRINKVDVAGKKIYVTPKDADKDVEVTITDDTVFAGREGDQKVDLERLQRGVEKAEGKGYRVAVTHEKGVASKIRMIPRKDGERKKGDAEGKGDEPRPKRERKDDEPKRESEKPKS